MCLTKHSVEKTFLTTTTNLTILKLHMSLDEGNLLLILPHIQLQAYTKI
jgi:hypothetical protein